jgi:hypothetical protein
MGLLKMRAMAIACEIPFSVSAEKSTGTSIPLVSERLFIGLNDFYKLMIQI